MHCILLQNPFASIHLADLRSWFKRIIGTLPRPSIETTRIRLMSHKELTDALEAVNQQLSDSDHLDAGEVEKLRATMGEIQAVLDQQGDRDESLSERVAGSARRFEASHPVLTENLGRIADILQQMGI
jgi:hypothetical protein